MDLKASGFPRRSGLASSNVAWILRRKGDLCPGGVIGVSILGANIESVLRREEQWTDVGVCQGVVVAGRKVAEV